MRLEEILDRARRGVLNIDLAFGEPLQQLIGRQIDQHDLVGEIEHLVGHGLAHPHLADAQHHIVQAFEVLDVERGPDIDARRQQFVDVLPALGMARARHIGVGIFVDQQQARPPRQRGVDIEFPHHLIAVHDPMPRQHFEVGEQLLGFLAAVRFDQASDHIAAAGLFAMRRVQHRKGLADARSGAKKDLQPTAAFLAGHRQQRIWRRPHRIRGVRHPLSALFRTPSYREPG